MAFKKTNVQGMKQVVDEKAKRVPWLLLSDVQSFLRFLPTWKEGGFNHKPMKIHWNIAGRKFPIYCGKGRNGSDKRCYVCEKMEELASSTRQEDRELAAKMKPNTKYAYNVIDLKNAGKGPQPYQAPWAVQGAIERKLTNPAAWGRDGDITDPELGNNCMVTKEGGKGHEKYSCEVDPTRVPLNQIVGYSDEWANKLFNLDEVTQPLSYDRMKAVYEGEEDLVVDDDVVVEDEMVIEEAKQVGEPTPPTSLLSTTTGPFTLSASAVVPQNDPQKLLDEMEVLKAKLKAAMEK